MTPSEKRKTAGLKSLADYISENHDGNQSDFARSIGVTRSQVQHYLNAKKPVYVVNGKLVQVIRELSIKG